MLKHSLIALAALGAGLVALPVSQASAFPTAPALSADGQSLATEVKDRNDKRHGDWNGKWSRNRHGDRCHRRSNRCKHYYRGFYYENPWWIFPMIGAGIALSDRGSYYDGYGSRHVEWCLDHYRSYNIRTNTWVSYSGHVRQCISPYGP
jgi:hypothetical protein